MIAHSSGCDSVDETRSFGNAVSPRDTQSDPSDEMVASVS